MLLLRAMETSHALQLVQPLIEATHDMKRRKVSKSRCDELLLTLRGIPVGVFQGRGGDLERLWMQALSSFRYSLLLWLYGDMHAAQEEAEKASRKIALLRSQGHSPWPAQPAKPAAPRWVPIL